MNGGTEQPHPEKTMPRPASILVLHVLLMAAAPALAQDATSSASVIVVNQLERDFLVWINGEPRGLVEGGARRAFDGVEPGPLSLLASGVGTEGIVASEKRGLAAGQAFEWTLYPDVRLGEEKGTATLVLRNALDREVAIELGGNPAGTLAPGGSRTVMGLVAGDVTTVVSDLEGRELQRFPLSIIAGEIMSWTIR